MILLFIKNTLNLINIIISNYSFIYGLRYIEIKKLKKILLFIYWKSLIFNIFIKSIQKPIIIFY
jgi:hypothetical protein